MKENNRNNYLNRKTSQNKYKLKKHFQTNCKKGEYIF